MPKTFLQSVKDLIFFPVRAVFEHETLIRLGLTSIRDERFGVCLPFLRGEVLDVGCGRGNKFIQKIGRGTGLDAHYSASGIVTAYAEKMPFPDGKFRTITMMVSLRYMRDRAQVMREAHRVLDKDGLLLVLENHPCVNAVRRGLIWWDFYKNMEVTRGLTQQEITCLARNAGFTLRRKERYLYGLGALYILAKI